MNFLYKTVQFSHSFLCVFTASEEAHAWIICLDTIEISFISGQTCSVKRVLLEILQNSQENSCARVSLIKLQALGLY